MIAKMGEPDHQSATSMSFPAIAGASNAERTLQVGSTKIMDAISCADWTTLN